MGTDTVTFHLPRNAKMCRISVAAVLFHTAESSDVFLALLCFSVDE